jgi:predicted MPP superfamily phosphohydrolase
MESSFYVAACLFHVVAAAAVAWTGRWLTRPERLHAPLREWSGRMAVAGLGWVAALSLAAAGLCVALSLSPFSWMRLVCQALFGELVILCAWLAVACLRARAFRAFAPAAAALALVAVYWQAYHREPAQLVVRHHTLDLAHGRPGARRLRLVHITDIQTEDVGAHERLAIDDAMREAPDLVVLTGDYAIGAQATRDLHRVMQEGGLRAPLGVYAVPGDVPDDGPALFAGLGVTWLEDRSVRVPLPDGGSLTLVGLSTAMSRTRDGDALARLVETAPRSELTIVLGHAPDFVEELAGRVRVDLALAGHTHGGQIVLPFLGPPLTLSRLPRRYAGDLNDYEGLPLHVSRGVGMERGTAPRIRFLCPPELCVLDVLY